MGIKRIKRINITEEIEKKIIETCLKTQENGMQLSNRECAELFDTSHTQVRNILIKNNYIFNKMLKKWIINDEYPSKGENVISPGINETLLKTLEIITNENTLSIDDLKERVNIIENNIKESSTLDSPINNNNPSTIKTTIQVLKDYNKLQLLNDDEGVISSNFKLIKSVHEQLRLHSQEQSLNRTALITVLISDYLTVFKEKYG